MGDKSASRRRVRRPIVELAIVFVGALLALAADGIRESRSEQAEAQQGLALLLIDLEEDSLEYSRIRFPMEETVARTAWLLENWDRQSLPADSVELALDPYVATMTPLIVAQLNRSAYVGLESTNRLRLLRPDSLRNAIIVYYQTLQEGTTKWAEEVGELRAKLVFERLPDHIIHPPGTEPGELWPSEGGRVRLRTSWGMLQSDAELHNLLVHTGRVMDFYAGRLGRAERATGMLMTAIRDQLAD